MALTRRQLQAMIGHLTGASISLARITGTRDATPFIDNVAKQLADELQSIPDYPAIGCYADGSSRNTTEGSLAVISEAESMGMPEVKYDWEFPDDNDDLTADQIEEIEQVAQDAEDWLNENKDVPCASWGWHDGDFGLWPDTDFDNDDVLKCQDIPSYIAQVSNHGNVTLYEVSLREVWACV